eukprot:GHVT01080544.1.p1 GENE.GHVT01080544.1~~GHVT01080544.1.p1  ORF type:complete len:1906 (-),score=201.35 GHVT01080544.1:917-6634(-)
MLSRHSKSVDTPAVRLALGTASVVYVVFILIVIVCHSVLAASRDACPHKGLSLWSLSKTSAASSSSSISTSSCGYSLVGSAPIPSPTSSPSSFSSSAGLVNRSQSCRLSVSRRGLGHPTSRIASTNKSSWPILGDTVPFCVLCDSSASASGSRSSISASAISPVSILKNLPSAPAFASSSPRFGPSKLVNTCRPPGGVGSSAFSASPSVVSRGIVVTLSRRSIFFWTQAKHKSRAPPRGQSRINASPATLNPQRAALGNYGNFGGFVCGVFFGCARPKGGVATELAVGTVEGKVLIFQGQRALRMINVTGGLSPLSLLLPGCGGLVAGTEDGQLLLLRRHAGDTEDEGCHGRHRAYREDVGRYSVQTIDRPPTARRTSPKQTRTPRGKGGPSTPRSDWQLYSSKAGTSSIATTPRNRITGAVSHASVPATNFSRFSKAAAVPPLRLTGASRSSCPSASDRQCSWSASSASRWPRNCSPRPMPSPSFRRDRGISSCAVRAASSPWYAAVAPSSTLDEASPHGVKTGLGGDIFSRSGPPSFRFSPAGLVRRMAISSGLRSHYSRLFTPIDSNPQKEQFAPSTPACLGPSSSVSTSALAFARAHRFGVCGGVACGERLVVSTPSAILLMDATRLQPKDGHVLAERLPFVCDVSCPVLSGVASGLILTGGGGVCGEGEVRLWSLADGLSRGFPYIPGQAVASVTVCQMARPYGESPSPPSSSVRGSFRSAISSNSQTFVSRADSGLSVAHSTWMLCAAGCKNGLVVVLLLDLKSVTLLEAARRLLPSDEPPEDDDMILSARSRQAPPRATVTSVGFSPCGRWLATGTSSGLIHIFSVQLLLPPPGQLQSFSVLPERQYQPTVKMTNVKTIRQMYGNIQGIQFAYRNSNAQHMKDSQRHASGSPRGSSPNCTNNQVCRSNTNSSDYNRNLVPNNTNSVKDDTITYNAKVVPSSAANVEAADADENVVLLALDQLAQIQYFDFPGCHRLFDVSIGLPGQLSAAPWWHLPTGDRLLAYQAAMASLCPWLVNPGADEPRGTSRSPQARNRGGWPSEILTTRLLQRSPTTCQGRWVAALTPPRPHSGTTASLRLFHLCEYPCSQKSRPGRETVELPAGPDDSQLAFGECVNADESGSTATIHAQRVLRREIGYAEKTRPIRPNASTRDGSRTPARRGVASIASISGGNATKHLRGRGLADIRRALQGPSTEEVEEEEEEEQGAQDLNARRRTPKPQAPAEDFSSTADRLGFGGCGSGASDVVDSFHCLGRKPRDEACPAGGLGRKFPNFSSQTHDHSTAFAPSDGVCVSLSWAWPGTRIFCSFDDCVMCCWVLNSSLQDAGHDTQLPLFSVHGHRPSTALKHELSLLQAPDDPYPPSRNHDDVTLHPRVNTNLRNQSHDLVHSDFPTYPDTFAANVDANTFFPFSTFPMSESSLTPALVPRNNYSSANADSGLTAQPLGAVGVGAEFRLSSRPASPRGVGQSHARPQSSKETQAVHEWKHDWPTATQDAYLELIQQRRDAFTANRRRAMEAPDLAALMKPGTAFIASSENTSSHLPRKQSASSLVNARAAGIPSAPTSPLSSRRHFKNEDSLPLPSSSVPLNILDIETKARRSRPDPRPRPRKDAVEYIDDPVCGRVPFYSDPTESFDGERLSVCTPVSRVPCNRFPYAESHSARMGDPVSSYPEACAPHHTLHAAPIETNVFHNIGDGLVSAHQTMGALPHVDNVAPCFSRRQRQQPVGGYSVTELPYMRTAQGTLASHSSDSQKQHEQQPRMTSSPSQPSGNGSTRFLVRTAQTSDALSAEVQLPGGRLEQIIRTPGGNSLTFIGRLHSPQGGQHGPDDERDQSVVTMCLPVGPSFDVNSNYVTVGVTESMMDTANHSCSAGHGNVEGVLAETTGTFRGQNGCIVRIPRTVH